MRKEENTDLQQIRKSRPFRGGKRNLLDNPLEKWGALSGC